MALKAERNLVGRETCPLCDERPLKFLVREHRLLAHRADVTEDGELTIEAITRLVGRDARTEPNPEEEAMRTLTCPNCGEKKENKRGMGQHLRHCKPAGPPQPTAAPPQSLTTSPGTSYTTPPPQTGADIEQTILWLHEQAKRHQALADKYEAMSEQLTELRDQGR